MARVEVPMPQMGESIAEGTVSVWLKKVGDLVERDEPIMEISTDKVDAEIPSPTAGTLVEIVVQEGETVEVGTVVAYVETEAGAAAAAQPAAEAAALPAAAAGQPEVGSSPAAASPAASQERSSSTGEDHGSEGGDSLEERLRQKSSPLVRRIAAEHEIRLSEIEGSGRMGRVTKSDILAYVEERKHAPAAKAGNGSRGAAPQEPKTPQASRREAGDGDFSWDSFYGTVQHPEVSVGASDRVEPMSRMTSIIAQNMVTSRRISPHVHSYFEVDYSRIDQVRAKNRKTWDEQGVKVTYTAFIAKAVAQALRENPVINASVSGNNVVFRGEVNIGVAVALDKGLIVPVVRNADELSLVGLSRRIIDLAMRARDRKLKPEEIQGGTFTITNPGIFGTTIGFPIISQPQVAILGVGGVEKRAVVVTDEFGNDAIVARKRGYISLGYDHRVVNGADGDQFLARVKELMETVAETG
jgi:pyruvate dehydrogenase E2 component (dihydrolipoamide acetyltransferase)